jgi:beta-aspartyl-dipeptidase (metallo-type)
MQFTLIEHGTMYIPEARGAQSLLLAGDRIAKIGVIDRHSIRAVGLELDVIDASGCLVVPGLIDPHAHLIGAGGEEGFASRMPEMLMSQIVCAGVTTIIGLLGTDTSTRHLSCLHAKVSQLWDEGLTAYMYTGGFELPPSTMTGSVLNDLVMIDKIIGTGEIAISDPRWIDPQLDELAHVVAETSLGGRMGGKAGVTHFHTGPGKNKLMLLHQLLDNYDFATSSLYATHIHRNEALMDDAITLAKRGIYVDMDTVEEDLGERLDYYLSHDGPLSQLTVSSDAHTPKGSTRKLYEQFIDCVHNYEMPMTTVLPLFTSNTARVLKLEGKGRLEAGNDADVLILREDTLEIVHVFARGRHLVKDGRLIHLSKQEQQVQAGKE